MTVPGTQPERRRILAEILAAERNRAAGEPLAARTPAAPRRRTDRDVPAPLSFRQEGLWLADRLAAYPEQYTVPLAIEITGKLDVAAMRAALRAVVGRHEILRTTYTNTPDGVRQNVHPEATLDLVVVDLTAATPDERRVAVAEAVRHRYDLAVDYPLRVRLYRFAPRVHVLVLTVHHIACDAWSADLLYAELRECYGAARAGGSPDLPALPVQYADYAIWQRETLDGDRLAELLRYWTGELEGAPLVLDLPYDRPRSDRRSAVGRFHRARIPEELTARVHSLARRERTTPFAVLLALYRLLISLHAGTGDTGDTVIGTPATGRGLREVDHLIGCFLNMLAIRGRIEVTETFRGLVVAEHRRLLGALAHQDLPFECLLEHLRPAREGDMPPLFQVTFAYRPQPPTPPDLAGATAVPFVVPGGGSQYDLTLDLVASGGGVDAIWAYDDALFDPDTIAGLAERFTSLVDAATARPDTAVGDLPRVTAAERERLLAAGRAKVRDAGSDADVSGVVAAGARRHGPAPAVVDGTGERTYAWLDRFADRLARHLRAGGLRPAERVGVSLGARGELPAALLGIARAGGTWLVIDPRQPADRHRFLLSDAGATTLIVADGALPVDLPGIRVINLDRDAAAIAAYGASPQDAPAPAPAFAAGLVSPRAGTGGADLVPYAALCRQVTALRGVLDPDSAKRVAVLDPAGSPAGPLAVLLPLASGGVAGLVPAPTHGPGPGAASGWDEVVRWLCRFAPTAVVATPRAWRHLLDAGWQPDQRPVALCAGAPLPPGLARRLAARCAGVYSGHGPEPVPLAMLHRPAGPPSLSSAPIGQPAGATAVRLLDDRLRLVPPGVSGEVFLSGDAIPRECAGQPARTAERFVPDPFGPPGGRLYRTGDLARWDRDGILHGAGRADRLVHVGGRRVDPGEVEAALTEVPGVDEALVTGGTRDRLTAYAVGPAARDTDALLDHARRRLPAHLVPDRVIALPAFPRTAAGAIDTAALPTPADGAPASPGAPPEGDVERAIARMWSAVLGVERPSRTDSFFDLGGHSLPLARLSLDLAGAFGVQVPFVYLFERPTIAEQAELVDRLLLEEVAAMDDDEAARLLRAAR